MKTIRTTISSSSSPFRCNKKSQQKNQVTTTAAAKAEVASLATAAAAAAAATNTQEAGVKIKIDKMSVQSSFLVDNAKFEISNFARKSWLQMEDEDDDYHIYEDIDLPNPAIKSLRQSIVRQHNLLQQPHLLQQHHELQNLLEEQQPNVLRQSEQHRKQLPHVLRQPHVLQQPRLNTRPHSKPAQNVFQKSSSDSDLFHLSVMHERHEIELSCDVVAGFEPEQGFYRCHDNLDDIQEKDIIPDLAPKLLREKRHLLREMSKELDVTCDVKTTKSSRRLSLDSGRGGSVVAEEDLGDVMSLDADAATISSTSLPSRTSSMSSGICSLKSSCSTLPRQDRSLIEISKGENTQFLFEAFDDQIVSSSSSSTSSSTSNLCLTSITSKPLLRPTSLSTATTKKENISSSKLFSRQKEAKKFASEAVRKLPAQPKRDLDERGSRETLTRRENGCASSTLVVSPPPPLPPRNSFHKKVATSENNFASRHFAAANEPSKIGQQRGPSTVARRTASKEVAQSVEALQQVSQDLLSLMQGPILRPASATFTPRPRLPSPHGEKLISSTINRFRESAVIALDGDLIDDDDLLVRSATLPCKRTLNFFDSSLLSDQKKKMDKVSSNNNNIECDATPVGIIAPILFVDENDENVVPARFRSRRRQSSIRFRTPVTHQRRTSDVTSLRSDVASRRSDANPTPLTASKGVKRRRTLFSISSPFSAKHKSGGSFKIRRTAKPEMASAGPKPVCVPDEETVPIVMNDADQKDFEDVVREGLPVIPFFHTPKTGSRSQPCARPTMTVQALATPMTSRKFQPSSKFYSDRLEDHLVLLAPKSRDLTQDGYFAMRSPCSGRHCQSCTCKISPKLLFTNDDNSDYVMMDSQTPNI